MGAALIAATLVATGVDPPDALARLAAGEPSCTEVQAAAERAASADPARAATWLSRASHAAWAPRIDFDWQHSDLDITKVKLGADPTVGVATGDRYGVRVTWDLSRAIFDLAEVRAALSTAELARLSTAVKREAADMYFRRQRRRLAVLTLAPSTPEARARLQLEVDALEATLDALTGGYFGRRLRALAVGPAPVATLQDSTDVPDSTDDANDPNTIEEDDE